MTTCAPSTAAERATRHALGCPPSSPYPKTGFCHGQPRAQQVGCAGLRRLRVHLRTPRAAARACTQVSRGLLPDTGSEYEGEGGRIGDALEFLLLNFTEMNKLWVRMQHQGSPKDRRAPARA